MGKLTKTTYIFLCYSQNMGICFSLILTLSQDTTIKQGRPAPKQQGVLIFPHAHIQSTVDFLSHKT